MESRNDPSIKKQESYVALELTKPSICKSWVTLGDITILAT